MVPSDEALLTRYKAGDVHAFHALVDRYTAPIYNLAFRFLHDSMEAENVTQETFLRVVTAIDRVRLDTPFKPYLFQVAVNLCRDLARKKHPLLFSDVKGGAESGESSDIESVPDGGAPLWERAEEQEQRVRLRDAVDSLPVMYRTVITLRYVEEFSYEEIALTLNLPINTVRTHLRRAKGQLREKLERDSDTLPSPISLQPKAKGGAG